MGTREKIFDTSVKLFCEHGYEGATVRDIAREVGIKAGSIYNHFSSKEELLWEMYDFFEREQLKAMPDLDTLLKRAETEEPLNILMSLGFHYPPEIQLVMYRINIIAAAEAHHDEKRSDFVKKNFFEANAKPIETVLSRLMELDRIEPVDIAPIVSLVVNFAFSAVQRNLTTYPMLMEEWLEGMKFVFSQVKLKVKAE